VIINRVLSIQAAGWMAQIAAIIALLWFSIRRHDPMPAASPGRVTWSQCALAVCGAWAWRLACLFLLVSLGFHCSIPDDASRFYLSWGWYKHPYLVTWDGIWQGGTFYVNGLAMHLIHDPLAAVRCVAVLFNLLALLGVFLFTDGIYRDHRHSILTVLFAAPWWIGVLLGTGTMPETPLIACLLSGAGLFLIGLTVAPRFRSLAWWAAALCFAAATSFHMVAWMVLGPILVVLLVHAWMQQRHGGAFRLTTWLWFAGVSVSYCVVWLIGCWVKFGSPFDAMRRNAQSLVQDSGITLLSARLSAYPRALWHDLWFLLPLVLFGIVWGSVRSGSDRGRVRTVLSVVGLGLGVLVASAVAANPDGHPDTTVVLFGMALLPIAVSPLLDLLSLARAQPRYQRIGAVALVALVGVFWAWDNQARAMSSLRAAGGPETDMIAVGSWLRAEMLAPHLLELGVSAPPVRVWTDSHNKELAIYYACGLLDRLEKWEPQANPVDSMQQGQYLVTDRDVQNTKLTLRFKVARYNVYQFGRLPPDKLPQNAGGR
jgi:hypothetical protein